MNEPGILDAKTNIPDNFDNFLSPLREPSDFCKTFKIVVNTNFPPNHDVAIYSNSLGAHLWLLAHYLNYDALAGVASTLPQQY